MIKPLIELVLAAVVFGSVPGGAAMPREVRDQAIRRLPMIAAVNLPRPVVFDAPGLPESEDRDAWPKLTDSDSLGVLVSAQSALVVDRDNGKILFEKDADAVRPIASITKLMTAMVFLETNPNLDQVITVEEEDLVPATSTIFVAGDQLPIRDLFFAAIIGSANDAARAMVRVSGLDSQTFINRMNTKARELGMVHTHFVEPTGLDARNVSTAREVAQLIHATRESPLIRSGSQQPAYRTQGSTKKSQFVKSTNNLLSTFLNEDPYQVVVAKTGSLDLAGYCLAASVDQNDHGVITVVLGSENHFSRFEDAKALTYWAFNKWAWKDK